jgi:hypothetical protein
MNAADTWQSPPPESPLDAQPGDRVPRQYQRVEIEYSKFGVEDFDFAFVTLFHSSFSFSQLAQVLQQDSIQRIGDSHSEFLYQFAGSGNALRATSPSRCKVSYHYTMLSGILPALRARFRHAHVRGRQGD